MRRILLFLSLLSMIMTVAAGSAIIPVSAQGNSEAVKLCQKGGWQDVQGANGKRFASQGECVSAAAQGAPLEPLPTGPNPAVTGVAYSDPDTGECRATFAFAYLDVDTRYWLVARQHDGTIIDAIDIVVAEESVNFGGTYRWQVQFHVSDGERVPIHAEVYDTADYSSLLADGGFISCQGMLP